MPHYLNIYEYGFSFSDVAYADLLFPGEFPFNFNSTGINAGQVLNDAVSINFNDTAWRNFKTLQRYIRKVGTLNLGTHDAGDRGIAELNFSGTPPKCRRSQTGMKHGIIIQNDLVLNQGNEAFNGTITQQTNFDEIPAEDRLPYRW